MELDEIRASLKGQEEWKKAVGIYRQSSTFDNESMYSEVLAIQESRAKRPPRNLQKQTARAVKIYAAEDNSYRSRIIYIRVQANRMYLRLDFTRDLAISWGLSYLGSSLKGSQADRRSKVATCFAPLSQRIQELYELIVLCDDVVADIDQSGWSRKQIVEVLEIELRPESKV